MKMSATDRRYQRAEDHRSVVRHYMLIISARLNPCEQVVILLHQANHAHALRLYSNARCLLAKRPAARRMPRQFVREAAKAGENSAYHPFGRSGAISLSSCSTVISPETRLPLMKKVGVALTPNFSAPRSRTMLILS